MSHPGRKNPHRRLAPAIIIGFIITAATAIRIPGLFTDLWIDEIWALKLLQPIRSFHEIFTAIHFDTNHWLYSLYLFSLDPLSAWPVYRMPSFIAGILSIFLLAFALTKRRLWPETATLLLLAGMSFFLTVYSTEARGYALAILFALVSFYSLQRFMEDSRLTPGLIFSICCILGLLSQLTFLFIYTAFFFWSCWHFFYTAPVAPRSAVHKLLQLHLAPIVFYIVLYFMDIQYIQHGGGPSFSASEIMLRITRLFTGAPAAGMFGYLALAVLVSIILFSCHQMRQEGNDLFVFYLIALILAPALFFFLGQLRGFSYWTERHYVICLPFVLLLCGRFLCWCWRRSRAGKAAYLLLMTLYLAGNSAHIIDFVRYGRGQYLDALKYIAKESNASDISITSDHDFRNMMLIEYYQQYLPDDVRFQYYKRNTFWPQDPEWLILHSDQKKATAPAVLFSRKKNRFELARHFPFGGISGWHWFVYRNTH